MDVVKGLPGGKHQVQRSGELLECQHELKTHVFIVKQVEERIVVRQVREAVLPKQVHDRPMAGRKFAQLFFGEAERVDDLLLFPLIIGVEGLLQVMADPYVVHDKPFLLGLAAHAVDTGDGLKQVVGSDNLVEIHHLLHRRVEASEQHVVDYQETHVAGDSILFAAKGHLEALDARLMPRLVRIRLQVRQIIVVA